VLDSEGQDLGDRLLIGELDGVGDLVLLLVGLGLDDRLVMRVDGLG
jgi:hypothetical protein